MTTKDFDVIILGGGITGAGTQRDCAMRGLRTLLIERSDIATGATGRNHGLLHSGARYAVNDAESAEECIRENMILRKIASHCIDETDGLFITLPEDDLAYQQTFVEACRKAGINAEIIDPKLAVRLDPAVNPALTGAVRVPDGSVDPFRLCAANMLDAKLHDGQVRLHTEVTGFILEGDTILGVRTRNLPCTRNRECLRHLGAPHRFAGRRQHRHVSRQGCPAGILAQGKPDGHQPVPETVERRYPGAGRYGLHHRHDIHAHSFRRMRQCGCDAR